MKAIISKPAKNPMQSGRTDRGWVLEYIPVTGRFPEPLMGWLGSGDTYNQVKMHFRKLEDATAFARREGLEYEIVGHSPRKIVPRNYTDNFRHFLQTV